MLNVQGQSRAVAQLQRALAGGRLASTWIFSGPLGVGKFTLARELARTRLCDQPLHQKNAARIPQLPPDSPLPPPCHPSDPSPAPPTNSHPAPHAPPRQPPPSHDKPGKPKATPLP